MKKIIITTAAILTSLSFMNHNESHAATKTVYDSNSTKMTQGYKVGEKTKHGKKIKYVGIKGKDRDYKNISNWKDQDIYKRSNNNWYNVGVTIDSKQFGNNVYLPVQLNKKTESMFNNNEIVSNKKFNDEFIKLANKDRKAKGLKPLKYANYLQKGTDQRSLEMAKYGSIGINGKGHIRPGSLLSFHTAHPNIKKPQYRLAENQAMLPFTGNPYEVVSEKHLAERAYKSFKKSPNHYAQLMSKGATHITNSIKIYSSQNINPNYESFIVTSTFDKY